jgi:hypothetical protein
MSEDDDIDLKLIGIFSYFQQKPDFAKCIKDMKKLLAKTRAEGFEEALSKVKDHLDEHKKYCGYEKQHYVIDSEWVDELKKGQQ